ncbi:MAG TPA: hypothetical protein PK079_20300 [Leptospiraceae bacterium]|nr:hypothetical protein [Leptospiraceae bacterium]HMW07943.1 hypothetical protein [Leptospiraceae bacterium]HMY34151.1 hypothetical protein [Leptospiraceae bacterium]HMZ64722.1 hypothetical protein [Leptospiraceae bacterium]HNA08973.1 hypothetical protein [Leptospiraceae bacterium]
MNKSIAILLIVLSPICSMAILPGRSLSANVSKVVNRLKEKNYTIEGGRRFHIGLKKNESVRYVITVPVFLSKTAIGIATDENVNKVRVVIFSQISSEGKERAIEGEDIESSNYIKEITDKSYHYIVEVTLLDTKLDQGYSSVDVLVAYAPMQLATKEDVKDFYYEHTGEIEYYSDPIRAKQAGYRKSDTGRIPCSAIDYGRTCVR